MVGSRRRTAAERGADRVEMKSVVRLQDIKLGVLFRLTFCLVVLHSCAHVSSGEMNDGYNENELTEHRFLPERAGQIPGLRGVGKVIEGDDENVEGDGKDSEISAKGVGMTTERVEEGAGEVVDEAGEAFGKTGECVGTRFKKCR